MKLTVDLSGLHETVRQMGAQDLVPDFSIELTARPQESLAVRSIGSGAEESGTVTTVDDHSIVSCLEESKP